MSIPISACLVTKAANGDEQAYSKFKAAMLKNLQHGTFSTYPCECNPRCKQPSDELLDKLQERLVQDLDNESN